MTYTEQRERKPGRKRQRRTPGGDQGSYTDSGALIPLLAVPTASAPRSLSFAGSCV